MACPRRCIVTLVAFVWFFSTVCFQMLSQIAYKRRCIGTLVAFVWFNDIVSLFLHDFYICILWTKIINFHLFDCHGVLCIAQMIASNWSNLIIYFWSLSESVKFSLAYFHFSALHSAGWALWTWWLRAFPQPDQQSATFPRTALLDVNILKWDKWFWNLCLGTVYALISWNLVNNLKFGWNYEPLLKFRNLVKILKFGWNFWLKLTFLVSLADLFLQAVLTDWRHRQLDDQHRNSNIDDNRDHLVGQLTGDFCDSLRNWYFVDFLYSFVLGHIEM